jgi:hypothetical protein
MQITTRLNQRCTKRMRSIRSRENGRRLPTPSGLLASRFPTFAYRSAEAVGVVALRRE